MTFFSSKHDFRTGLCLFLSVLFVYPAYAQTPAVETPPAEDIAPRKSSLLLGGPAGDETITSLPALSAEAPSDIVLLLDNSGSMKANDPQFLTAKAVTQFINQLDYGTRLAIVIFDQKVTLAHPLTIVSDESRAEMLKSLKLINYRGLRTNSPDGLERALYELKLHAREDAERFIVFLTDGIVDTGDKQKDITKVDWMRKELAADASEHGIKIFGIAFTDGADFQLIQSLAQQTNAEYFRAFTADKLAGVFEQIQEKITQVRQAAIQAEIEANKPPPVILAPPRPVAPPAPIIVQVPKQQLLANKSTQYMLYGIAGMLFLVLVIIILRGRSSTGAVATNGVSGVKIPEVELIDMRGITDQQSYPLKTTITQVGRIKGKVSNDVTYIVIPEKGVSRHHAVIEFRNHAFWVMDQGSGNGTKLNNRLLTEEQHLKHGDILTFDTFNFMFSEPDMEQSDATVVQASRSQAETIEPVEPVEPAPTPMPEPTPVPEPIPELPMSEDDTEMLPSSSKGSQESLEDLNNIIDDIGDWDLGEDSTDDDATAETEPAETKPAEVVDPVDAGLLTKTKDGFHPAKTMTPGEFDRLFAELDKGKKK